MAQQLRALTTLQKVLSSNPSNHMVAHNHPKLALTPSSGVSEDSYSVLTYNK
jgi:DNA repair protein RadC